MKTVKEVSRELGLRSELFPISPGDDSVFFSCGFLHLDQEGLIKVDRYG